MTVNASIDEEWKKYYISGSPEQIVLQTLVTVMTLMVNIINLYVFKRFRNIEIQHFYMIGLSIADIVTIIPNVISLIHKGVKVVMLSESLCNVYGIMAILPYEVTVGIQTAMCIDKCISVRNPIKYKLLILQHKRAKFITIGVILCCTAATILFDFILEWNNIIRFYFEPYYGMCYVEWDVISMIALGPYTILPLIVQGITYSLVIHKITSLKKNNRRRLLRATRTVFITIFLFYLSWLPHGILVFWITVAPNRPLPPTYTYWSALLLIANSSFSLPIYLTTLSQYRKIFMTDVLHKNVQVTPRADTTETRKSTNLG